ncbi:MAG: macro domain-containing protein [bacterium]
MSETSEDKKINPYLNHLAFHLYDLAKDKIKEISEDKNNQNTKVLPLEILKMVNEKMSKDLTVEEKDLLESIITDLGNSLKNTGGELKQVSTFDDEFLSNSVNIRNDTNLSDILEDSFCTVTLDRTSIQILQGDLISLPVEAIVSPDTTDLWMEQGLASIIRVKGGDSIRKEARQTGSEINICDVVATKAGYLPFNYILHAAIMLPDREIQKKTTKAYVQQSLTNILKIAEEKSIKTIAIPALGVATGKFPYDALAKTMFQQIFDYFMRKTNSSLELIVISLFNNEAFGHFLEQFKILAESNVLIIKNSNFFRKK